MHPLARRTALALGLLAPLAAAHAQVPKGGTSALNGQHPAQYFRAAADLFAAGRREEAAFVFYLGQLRFRTHLRARPGLPPDGDPALFAALSETVGRPINGWLGGDVALWVAVMDAALAADARDPDRFTPPSQFPEATRAVRDGLRALRDQTAANADAIRRERAARGLENR